MKKAILILALVMMTTIINAQIVITFDDVRNQLTIGRTGTEYVDTLAKMIDIGTLSNDNQWDFSQYGFTPAITYFETVKDAWESPYYSEFMSSSRAVHIVESTTEGLGEIWMHLGIYNDALVNYGYGSSAETRFGSGFALVKNEPPEDELIFPMTVGTYWTFSTTETTTFSVGVYEFTEELNVDVTCTIDAAGTMILPDGQEVEALRSHEIRHYEAETLDGTLEYTEVLYTFFSKYGHEVSISCSPGVPEEGTVLANAILWCNDGVVDVENNAEESVPTKFGLKQNYPNPFNPTTTIEYSITEDTNVKVKVYDILGNEVATLTDEFLPAGEYKAVFDACDLPSGNYFVRLQAGARADVKKMTLLK